MSQRIGSVSLSRACARFQTSSRLARRSAASGTLLNITTPPATVTRINSSIACSPCARVGSVCSIAEEYTLVNAPERISSLHASAVTNHGESPVGDGKRKTIGISQHVIYEVDTKEPP